MTANTTSQRAVVLESSVKPSLGWQGYEKKSLVNDVAMVKKQLKRGDAVIVYDKITKTSNIVSRDHLKKS